MWLGEGFESRPFDHCAHETAVKRGSRPESTYHVVVALVDTPAEPIPPRDLRVWGICIIVFGQLSQQGTPCLCPAPVGFNVREDNAYRPPRVARAEAAQLLAHIDPVC